MKRSFLTVVLILCAVFCTFGQDSTPIDLILLLDTSQAMSASNESVNNYITGDMLSEFLRVGDTFHLITYSDTQHLDAARRISGRGDVETIIGRMLIQFPVESGSDAAEALSFTKNYITTLPDRPKKIVMVGSGSSDVINSARQSLSGKNTTLDFVQITAGKSLSNLPSSDRASSARAAEATRPMTTASSAISQSNAQTKTEPNNIIEPAVRSNNDATVASAQETISANSIENNSTITKNETFSGTSSGAGTETENTALDFSGIYGSNENTAASDRAPAQDTQAQTMLTNDNGPSSASSESETSGSREAEAQQGTSGRESTQPQPSREAASQSKKSSSTSTGDSSLPIIIGIILGVLLLLALIIFLATRRLGSSPNRVMAAASVSPKPEKEDTPFADHSKDLAKYAAAQNKQRVTPYSELRSPKKENVKPAVINPNGPLLLNLFVQDQNTAIGKRNIHSLKSGYSLSVGGGKRDDYYIFLVPIPANIGEIRRNGSALTFIPHKHKYFPDIDSGEVRDCLNKTIRIISDKNYELLFRFEMYEDPLEALNKILTSVKVPN